MLKFNFVGKVKLEFVNDGNTKTSKLQSCLFELDPSPNLKRAIYLNPDGAPTEEGMKRLRDTLIHGLVALTSYAKDKNWLTMEEGFVFIGQSVKKGLEDYERIGTTFAVDESIDAPPEQKNFKSTYPGGFPLHFNNDSWLGNIRDDLMQARKHFYNFYTGEEPEPSKYEERLLVEFMIYYINAPIWRMNPYGKEPIETLIKKAERLKTKEDVHDFIDDCMDIGLDPL